MQKSALIFGIGGQDGAYLASLLLGKGYSVTGTSRDRELSNFSNLTRLGIYDRVTLRSASLVDFRSVIQVITATEPHEIYNLAGQSSVGLSFEQPVETIDGSVNGTINILEAMRFLKSSAHFYNASSSECFGNTGDTSADEMTPFRPCSPYGVGKAAAHWLVSNYRDAYGLFACSGILFNHESPLRPTRFVTQKIVHGAIDVAEGKTKQISMGSLAVWRDWGWAPEYVDAMWRMLQLPRPEDFVIATGETHSLQEFVDRTFSHLGLDSRRHVVCEPGLQRPLDILKSAGSAEKARQRLGWIPQTKFASLITKLVEAARSEHDLAGPTR